MATEKLNYRDLIYETDPTTPRVGKVIWAKQVFDHKRRAFKEAERARERAIIKQERVEQETAFTKGNLRLLRTSDKTHDVIDLTDKEADAPSTDSKSDTKARTFESSLQTICDNHQNGVKVDRSDRDQMGWAAMTSHYYGPGVVELNQLPNGRLFGEFNLRKGTVTLSSPGMNSSVHGKRMTYEE